MFLLDTCSEFVSHWDYRHLCLEPAVQIHTVIRVCQTPDCNFVIETVINDDFQLLAFSMLLVEIYYTILN